MRAQLHCAVITTPLQKRDGVVHIRCLLHDSDGAMDIMPGFAGCSTDVRRGVHLWQFEESGAEFIFQQEQDEQEQTDPAELFLVLEMQSHAGDELECPQPLQTLPI